VTDDYYEDESLAKCAELGHTPYGPVIDQEIVGHSTRADTRGERERDALTSTHRTNALSSFYTIGGPSTHFGGTGIDPWTEGGHGHRHAKMRQIGISAQDWMYVTAQSCREVDLGLKGYREERVGMLEGRDLDGWVWTAEAVVEGGPEAGVEKVNVDGGESGGGLKPPTMDRQRSGLSREVTFEPEPEAEGGGEGDLSMEVTEPEPLPGTEAAGETTTPMVEDEQSALDPLLDVIEANVPKTNGGELRLETPEEAEARKRKWALGPGSWAPGTIIASYEVRPSPDQINSSRVLTDDLAAHPHAPCPDIHPTHPSRDQPYIPLPHPPTIYRFQPSKLCSIDSKR
jgi:chromatin structure-remodeling complex protein RSC7